VDQSPAPPGLARNQGLSFGFVLCDNRTCVLECRYIILTPADRTKQLLI